MKKKLNQLTFEEIEYLKSHHDVLSFSNDFDLVYEKQVPNAGVALIEGEIELTKNRSALEIILPGCLLGVHHLLNEEPVRLGCKVKKNSKVILIGKSEIVDSVMNRKSMLFDLLKNYLEEEK